MDTITTMFAIDVAAGGLALVSIGGVLRYGIANRRLRTENTGLLSENIRLKGDLGSVTAERDSLDELAGDAQANIERLQTELGEAKAAAGRWAGKYSTANAELRKIERERTEAAASRKVRMRTIGIIGNRSPKRRRNSAAA